MLPIDIIRALHKHNAIFGVEYPPPDMSSMLEKFGMVGLKAEDGGETEEKPRASVRIVDDVEQLVLRREFLLTSGGAPEVIKLSTNETTFRKRLYVKFEKDVLQIFSDEINDKDITAIALRTQYIKDVKVNAKWLQIASDGPMLAIELPAKEAYES